MKPTVFSGVGYSQQLNTCVLASYAVACLPFTHEPVLSYFAAYCRHFNKLKETFPKLDEAHPERSYESHFHKFASLPGNSGYKVLKELHDGSQEPEFRKARDSVVLEPVDLSKPDRASVEQAMQRPDCLLLLFVNASNFPGLSMHSIVVGHDGLHLYYFDTAVGAAVLYRHRLCKLADFGGLGDAYIVRKKT